MTIVSIPVSQVRAGFFFSPTLELEPRLGLLSTSGGGERFTQIQLDLGLLMHFGASRLQRQTYLRPFVGVSSTDIDEGDSSTGAAPASASEGSSPSARASPADPR